MRNRIGTTGLPLMIRVGGTGREDIDQPRTAARGKDRSPVTDSFGSVGVEMFEERILSSQIERKKKFLHFSWRS
jgi:hypothetical protein